MLARIRDKNIHKWLGGYLRWLARERDRGPRASGPRHLVFALCDHYEPLWGDATDDVGDARVLAWEQRYPEVCGGYRDADGRPPRHSFFFPGEEYRPRFLDRLASLARAGFGEVEYHLHHDGDTAATLRPQIERHLALLADHGHLSRDANGRPRYAFIHGNWALANGRDDRRWCGVDDELVVLHATGCYADFTFPSAPDSSQPGIVNQIYWPAGDISRARSYDRGDRARVGDRAPGDRPLMIQGPLAVARRRGHRPPIRIENGALFGHDPPSAERVATWVRQHIAVAGRPEWVFVKVHAHGAPEDNAASLLGDGARALHDALAAYNDGACWRLHYATAREMYNIARAAIDGRAGDPNAYRDYLLPPPPVVG